MANSITGVNEDIIAQGVLRGFTETLTPANAFSTDFSQDAVRKGDTISILTDNTAIDAVQSKTSGSDYTIQIAASTATEISLNKHQYVSFAISDVERANSSVVNLETYAVRKGHALAKSILDDSSNGIWASITAANFSTAGFTGAATTFDADDVVDLMDAADDANWSPFGRSLVLSNAYYTNLLKDNAIQSSSAFGSSDPIRQGVIPNIAGFDVYKSNIIPDNGENLTGFYCVKDAFVAAFRYLEPGEGNKYDRAERITDPESGATLGIRTWYDEDSGERRMVIESVYGFSVGLGTALERITSA